MSIKNWVRKRLGLAVPPSRAQIEAEAHQAFIQDIAERERREEAERTTVFGLLDCIDLARPLDQPTKDRALELFAADCVERVFVMHRNLKEVEAPEAEWMLEEVRVAVDRGQRLACGDELFQRALASSDTLDEYDLRRTLWQGVSLLLSEQPEQMAKDIYFWALRRMLLYGGGPYVQGVRTIKPEYRDWIRDRMRWRLESSVQPVAMPAHVLPTHGVRMLGRRLNPLPLDLRRRLDDPASISPVGARLVEAILECPADDGAREVYADFIGGEEGELIALQCRLAQRPGAALEQTLYERTKDIVHRLTPKRPRYRLRYRRGFPAGVLADTLDLLDEDEAKAACVGLRVLQPNLMHLNSIDADAARTELRMLLASSVFEQLTEVGFDEMAFGG